ncbi:MAG: zinc-binding alcohol dehydrogenase family protein [Gammaproteobacteria bacterium]
MRAIGYNAAGPVDGVGALVEFDAPEPALRERDLLVEVRAVSMNPVDTKVRGNMAPEGGTRIIGYDAAGVVTQVGAKASLFNVGDEVFYAGDLTRPGTNAALHAVDERIVGRKPASLNFSDAAALPLTAITAWELMFDSLALHEDGGAGEVMLIVGGAGGVGSILIQLAKALTKLTVVATASRSQTSDWVKKMGADHVINHREPLAAQLETLGLVPRYVAALTATDQHFEALVDLMKPRGHMAMIDDPGPVDISLMKRKALSLSWEFMFTRSMFGTDDMIVQHQLLDRVADMVDASKLVTTATHHGGAMSVETLTAAHVLQQSGRAIGKTVLDGF